MGERLTLVADARAVAGREVALPGGLTMRAVTDADAEALAQLYLSAYHPSPGAMSLIETREEMCANFAGESGELWREASPVVVDADGVARACAAQVGDWRSRLPRVEPKPRRGGILGSADAMSGALAALAMLVVVGGVAAIVGLVWLVGAAFFSVFAGSSTPVSPSPSVSVSVAP